MQIHQHFHHPLHHVVDALAEEIWYAVYTTVGSELVELLAHAVGACSGWKL
jgi:hypothetical protein